MRHRKKIFVIILLLVLIELTSIFLMYKAFNNKNIIIENISNNLNTFAIMLEDDSGNYILSNNISWPTDEYRYNSFKSGCVDDDNNQISDALYFDGKKAYVEGDTSLYCYLYFDKKQNVYAIYSETDNSLTFIASKILPVEGSTLNDKIITKVFSDFIDEVYYNFDDVPWIEYRSNIERVVVATEIEPLSTAMWFYKFVNCSYFDLEKLDTSNVEYMWYMFGDAGNNSENIEFIGLENWNVENVKNMSSVFRGAGANSFKFNLDLSGWNTKNVVDMGSMFLHAGYNSSEFNLGDLSDWNTGNVTAMMEMFRGAGMGASRWYIGQLTNWETSKVQNMKYMFAYTGYNAEKYELDLSGWDVRNVTDMEGMFYNTAYKSEEFSLGNISEWEPENATNMYAMFSSTGRNAEYTLDLSGWSVSKVTNYGFFNSEVESKIIAPSFGTTTQ